MPHRSKIIGGAMLLLPLVVWPGFGDEIRQPKAVALLLFAGLAFSFYLWQRVAPEVGAFFGYVTLNAVFTGFNHSHQMLEWVYIGAALGVGSLVSRATAREMEWVLKGIQWGALINAAYAYVQLAGKDFIFIYRSAADMQTPTGFLGQQTLLGPFLASGVIISLYYRQWHAALFLLPPILISGSSFTYASLGAGVLLWVIHAHGFKKALGVAALVSLPMPFLFWKYPDLLHSRGRDEMWLATIKRTFQEAPFFGRGFGTFKYYAAEMQTRASMEMNGYYREAHSDVIQLLHDGGAVGMILAGVIFFYFLRQAVLYFRFREVACAASVALLLLVNASGNFILRLVPQGPIFVLTLIFVTTFHRGEYVHDR